METRDLRIFLTVVDENGMAAAARRLGLGRTTITERVAVLEKAIGQPLFVRSPLTLTVAGRTLEPFARRVVREVEKALEEVSGLATSRARSGALTVGLMAGGAAELNAPIFAGLHRAAPELRVRFVHLSLAETETSVAQGHVDVAILRSPVGDPALRGVPLFLCGRVALVALDGPFGELASMRCVDLADATMTGVHPQQSHEFVDFFLLTGERNGERPRTAPALTLYDAAYNVIARGAVAAPSLDAVRVIPCPGTRAVPLLDAPVSGPIAVCRRDDRRPVIDTFMRVCEHVARTCGALVPDTVPLTG